MSDAVVTESMAQAHQLWHIRESIPLAQAEEGLNIKHDISIPISSIPEFVRVTDEKLAVAYPGIRLVNYGHLGDGNLHYNVSPAKGATGENFVQIEAAVNRIAHDAVHRGDGLTGSGKLTGWRRYHEEVVWALEEDSSDRL